jgi:hypothetical protein
LENKIKIKIREEKAGDWWHHVWYFFLFLSFEFAVLIAMLSCSRIVGKREMAVAHQSVHGRASMCFQNVRWSIGEMNATTQQQQQTTPLFAIHSQRGRYLLVSPFSCVYFLHARLRCLYVSRVCSRTRRIAVRHSRQQYGRDLIQGKMLRCMCVVYMWWWWSSLSSLLSPLSSSSSSLVGPPSQKCRSLFK